jgi:hypothetical protein
MFEIKKTPKAVIIAGTGDGYEFIPKNTNKTLYCLNDWIRIERFGLKPDILFIMDVLDEKPQVVSGIQNLGESIAKINQMKIPLIAPFKYEEIPLSQAFPLKECAEEFGKPYFSNTISYMIAYTLLEFLKIARKENPKIRLLNDFSLSTYGVNQASSSEYFYEKASVEYWLGIANGLGVDITINGSRSELLCNKKRFGGSLLYGYNQTYDEIVHMNEKFGEQIVKKLFTPRRSKPMEIKET